MSYKGENEGVRILDEMACEGAQDFVFQCNGTMGVLVDISADPFVSTLLFAAAAHFARHFPAVRNDVVFRPMALLLQAMPGRAMSIQQGTSK